MRLLVILRNVIKEAEEGPGFGRTAYGLTRLPSHERRGSWTWVWENCMWSFPATFPRAKGVLSRVSSQCQGNVGEVLLLLRVRV